VPYAEARLNPNVPTPNIAAPLVADMVMSPAQKRIETEESIATTLAKK
tara:strand:- start:664 stop:807 length:144 start_codon:yes stop_codon:yes gene_type:complete